jgi:hypothetical protein
MIKQLWSFFKFLCKGSEEDEASGLGQSFADELRWWHTFIKLKKEPIRWRKPTPDEQLEHDAHADLGRFGDLTYAVATFDGCKLIVRERCWHGWPDPPEFVLFAFHADGTLWCAHDFDWWPKTWKLD